MKYIICIFFLSSCSLSLGGTRKVADELEPYVSSFEELYGEKIDYSVQFNEQLEENNWVGVCRIYVLGKREVEIKRAYWNKSLHLEKEEIVFHELGHCTLERDHLETRKEYKGIQIPVSIMFPVVFGNWFYYKELRNDYINELFDRNVLIKRLLLKKDVIIFD